MITTTKNNTKKPIVHLKKCTTCGGEWPIEEGFRKQSAMSDGHKNTCKKCDSEYNKKRYKEKREEIKAKARAWNEANPEKLREYRKTWREKQKQ